MTIPVSHACKSLFTMSHLILHSFESQHSKIMVSLCKLICVHASGYPSTPDLNSNWCYLGTGIWKRDLPGKHKNVVL